MSTTWLVERTGDNRQRHIVTHHDDRIQLGSLADGKWGVLTPPLTDDYDSVEVPPPEVHALWRCESPEKAVALAAWLDEHGDDLNAGKPPHEPGTTMSEELHEWWSRFHKERGSAVLIFRNGAPRGPKGKA